MKSTLLRESAPRRPHCGDRCHCERCEETLSTPGEALDAGLAQQLGSRLGHDFSRVRVHADAKAGASARAVDAKAYTVGEDVVVDPAHYHPGSAQTQRLLAHELVHVMQQRAPGGAVAGPQHEREASRLAARVISGTGLATVGAGVLGVMAGALQREPAGPTPAPTEAFAECDPALQSDLRTKHPVALAHVADAISTLGQGWDHMAPTDKAVFQRYFDPSGSGDVDDGFVRDVRSNFVRIRSYMQNLTFDCNPESGTLCGSSKKWCVGGRLMWTCFGNLHVCVDAYRNTSDDAFKTETMIHESVHNALHVTDRAYSNSPEFQKLKPRAGGILGFLANVPILGGLFRPLLKLFGSSDTLYNPDSYARYAMEAGSASS